MKTAEKNAAPQLNFYEVFVTFAEEGKVTLAAPSEEAAIALVKDQYSEKLGGLVIQGVKFIEPVQGEGKYIN